MGNINAELEATHWLPILYWNNMPPEMLANALFPRFQEWLHACWLLLGPCDSMEELKMAFGDVWWMASLTGEDPVGRTAIYGEYGLEAELIVYC